ncbi:MAG: hypothetical protein AB7J13_01665 [Pyrinomonadaceae bacterium]
MITEAAFSEILAMYRKHGWLLRRLLLRAETQTALGERLDKIGKDVPVLIQQLDAAWFSRPPGSSDVTWELRSLGDEPFALLETMDEESPGFEGKIEAVQIRLKEAVARKSSA